MGFGDDWLNRYFPDNTCVAGTDEMQEVMAQEYMKFCVTDNEFEVFAREVPWFIGSTRVKIVKARISLIWPDGFEFVIMEYRDEFVF